MALARVAGSFGLADNPPAPVAAGDSRGAVITSMRVGGLIIAEAGLSFLGISAGGTRPTWGAMVAEGQSYILKAWWIAITPGSRSS